MRYVIRQFVLLLLVLTPTSVLAEPWQYACAEAITFLKQVQDEVMLRHESLQQAKLYLKMPPKGFESCRTGHGGFEGGFLHCVRHRSQGTNGIKEVIKAEHALETAMGSFNEHLHALTQVCRADP